MPVTTDIIIQDDRWNALPFDLERVTDAVVAKTAMKTRYSDKKTELSLVLCDDDTIQAMNSDYRGKNKPTNVLSFPQIDSDEGESSSLFDEIILGDIVVSYDTLEKEAQEQDKSFQDHYTHMLVHGFLHLCGFDHMNDNDAEIMESLEIEILRDIGVKNPYLIQNFMS